MVDGDYNDKVYVVCMDVCLCLRVYLVTFYDWLCKPIKICLYIHMYVHLCTLFEILLLFSNKCFAQFATYFCIFTFCFKIAFLLL